MAVQVMKENVVVKQNNILYCFELLLCFLCDKFDVHKTN